MRANLLVVSLLAAAAAAASAAVATVLFPTPLHLTRTLDDPLSGTSSTIEEYYSANRVVTVRGDHTVIVDYDKREMTEIDRTRATYSITTFDEMSKARTHRAARSASAAKPSMERTGSDRRGGRDVEIFTADDRDAALHAEIAIDSSIALSRDAFDVIVGAAYPNDGGPAADLSRGAAKRRVVRAEASGAKAAENYGLPIEQTLRWEIDGATVISKSRVIRTGAESVPPDALAIPPGAQRVESRLVRTKRLADEIDSLPSKPASH